MMESNLRPWVDVCPSIQGRTKVVKMSNSIVLNMLVANQKYLGEIRKLIDNTTESLYYTEWSLNTVLYMNLISAKQMLNVDACVLSCWFIVLMLMCETSYQPFLAL